MKPTTLDYAALEKMWNSQKVALNPDLAKHIVQGPMGNMLHHPLVISVMYSPIENARLNMYYEQKRATIEEAIQQKNWPTFVFAHERPYRIDAINQALCLGLADDSVTYWQLVGIAWTDSENIHQNIDDWIDLLLADVPNREEIMDDEEHIALSALPETITVYRGVHCMEAAYGLSWTTDLAKAEWFAKRYKNKIPMVFSGNVCKSNVIAHFLGRNEKEIVVHPEDVNDCQLMP